MNRLKFNINDKPLYVIIFNCIHCNKIQLSYHFSQNQKFGVILLLIFQKCI